jgi:hypothetical protein
MVISDSELFGLAVAQSAEEERREAGRGRGLLISQAAVRTHQEAVDYTAEIMERIGAERCAICGRWYLPVDDCPLCSNCLAYENHVWVDHRDEVAAALAATNGTL